MGRAPYDTTLSAFLAAYEAICALGAEADTTEGASTQEMRRSFESRTGRFRSEDPWFEQRSRAFWDDALTTQGFARAARPRLGEQARAFADAMVIFHRGLFTVRHVDDRGAHLVDELSGTELLTTHVDEAQAIALAHAEGYADARVIAVRAPDDTPRLIVLPGVFHHPPDASPEIARVVAKARDSALEPPLVLDALLRMELVLRASSRVKASFAYRPESLSIRAEQTRPPAR